MAQLNPFHKDFSLFGGENKQPEYHAPAPYQQQQYTPYGQAPGWQDDGGQSQGASNVLQDAIYKRMLGNYANGGPLLDQNYRQARLQQSQADVQRQQTEANRGITEEMNSHNLLGSTGYGTALGYTAREGQRNMQQVNTDLMGQEMQMLPTALQAGLSLNQALMSRRNQQQQQANFGFEEGLGQHNKQFDTSVQQGQYGYGQQVNAAENQYHADSNNYRDEQNRRQQMVGLLGSAGMSAATGGMSGPGGLLGALQKRRGLGTFGGGSYSGGAGGGY